MSDHHAIQNISLQIPVKLARMLDARIDAERGSAVLGPVNRSSVIRAALAAYLEGTKDPKEDGAASKYSRPREYRPRQRRIMPVTE